MATNDLTLAAVITFVVGGMVYGVSKYLKRVKKDDSVDFSWLMFGKTVVVYAVSGGIVIATGREQTNLVVAGIATTITPLVDSFINDFIETKTSKKTKPDTPSDSAVSGDGGSGVDTTGSELNRDSGPDSGPESDAGQSPTRADADRPEREVTNEDVTGTKGDDSAGDVETGDEDPPQKLDSPYDDS